MVSETSCSKWTQSRILYLRYFLFDIVILSSLLERASSWKMVVTMVQMVRRNGEG